MEISLDEVFDQINREHFDGFLDRPVLLWNSRLKVVAGRFRAGLRRSLELSPPRIEIASYLRQEKNAEHHVRDTMAHEMIHYWLWVRRRPHGHTLDFKRKMREMGVTLYNPVPQQRNYKYLYQCPVCQREYYARKLMRGYACKSCCKKHGGRFNRRFEVSLLREL